jgi:hypothetical protein
MYQPFDLSGRGVVVTGGNGGIGLGMARALLASGAKVAIWGNRADKTARARGSSRPSVAMPAACTPSCATWATRRRSTSPSPPAWRAGSRARVLCQCRRVQQGQHGDGHDAGRIPPGAACQRRRRVPDLPRRGAPHGRAWPGRLAGGHGQHRGGGRRGAQQPLRRQQGRGDAFVRALAVELARHRIRVNSILPGWIVTDMTERSVGNDKFAGAVMPRIPARRWGEIDDFGGIAVYLASDAARATPPASSSSSTAATPSSQGHPQELASARWMQPGTAG